MRKDWVLVSLVLLILGFSIPETPKMRIVTGIVTDGVDGSRLKGVTVASKKAKTRAVTDTNGKYSIQIFSEKETLIFSLNGFTAGKLEVGSRTIIDVSLVGMDQVPVH